MPNILMAHPFDSSPALFGRSITAMCCCIAVGTLSGPISAVAQPAFTALFDQAAFSHMPAGGVSTPWRVAGLPRQKFPLTQFTIESLGGDQVLRVQADGSYGNLVIDADRRLLPPQSILRWRWQLGRGLPSSDLQRKDGDDTPIKVCALFDMALTGMSLGEQTRLRMARAVSGEPLPAATLCYVWDRRLPEGRVQPNVFSPRVRYLVVRQGPAEPGVWHRVERPLAQDFLQAFGDESSVVPPLMALAVGADADNTGGHSLAWVGDIQLTAP